MTKHITSNLAEALRMKTAVFLMLLLGAIYPAAISHANAQTPSKRTPASQGSGQKEGIKVHGHWTIDVRNPNGKLVTHHEFENALVPSSVLASLLGRVNVVGKWGIVLGNPAGDPCGETTPGGMNWYLPCSIDESPGTLRVTADGSALVLTGSVTAVFNSSIKYVKTHLGVCTANVTPGVCLSSAFTDFPMTAATLAQPVPVTAGQIIQVTVTITFS